MVRPSMWTLPVFLFFLSFVSAVGGEVSSSINEAFSHSGGCLVRGGETELEAEGRFPAIDEFLAERDLKESMKHFHIHGWRWHTASLVRESGRLCNLAQRAKSTIDDATSSLTQALEQAADYVVGFNMKGLHRIEADLMFPWMREKLTATEAVPPEAAKEFASIMSQLETDRRKLVELGDAIIQSAAIATNINMGKDRRSEAIENVVEKSSSLQDCAKAMMDVENNRLVPAISKVVPESEQHSFNNKVLRNLGLWDSRLHLVAMYEAVEESGNADEIAMFEQAIPSIPQMMIPRWKRKLYEPRAGVLDMEL